MESEYANYAAFQNRPKNPEDWNTEVLVMMDVLTKYLGHAPTCDNFPKSKKEFFEDPDQPEAINYQFTYEGKPMAIISFHYDKDDKFCISHTTLRQA